MICQKLHIRLFYNNNFRPNKNKVNIKVVTLVQKLMTNQLMARVLMFKCCFA